MMVDEIVCLEYESFASKTTWKMGGFPARMVYVSPEILSVITVMGMGGGQSGQGHVLVRRIAFNLEFIPDVTTTSHFSR